MVTTTIKDLYNFDAQEVEIKGWVYNIRSVGKIWFIILRDGTGLLQCVVVNGEASNESFALEQTLNQEDSIIINGIVNSAKCNDRQINFFFSPTQ